MNFALLLHLLLTLTGGSPSAKGPILLETKAEHQVRMSRVATSLSIFPKDNYGWHWSKRELQLVLISTLYIESGFHHDVHSGKKLGDNGRAACLAQLHVTHLVPRERWHRITGTGLRETATCIQSAANVLGHLARTCTKKAGGLTQSKLRIIFNAYQSGRCNGPGHTTKNRIRVYWKLWSQERKLRKGLRSIKI